VAPYQPAEQFGSPVNVVAPTVDCWVWNGNEVTDVAA
jgi:hypothetical protein